MLMVPYADNAFWFSKLSDARRCLRYYKYKHIDKIPLVDPSLDLEFGTAYHLAVNEILSKEGNGQETFLTYWESVNREVRRTRYGWEDLALIGPTLVQKFRDGAAKYFKPILMEERLYGKVGKHDFEGTPDFYGTFKGKLAVFDFKTSANNYPKEKLVAGEQLPGYAHMLEQNGHALPEIVGYSVAVKNYSEPRIQMPLTMPLTQHTMHSMITNIAETCDDLAGRKVFPKNPSACSNGTWKCPYFSKCFGGVTNEGE